MNSPVLFRTIPALLASAAARTPERPAVDDGQSALSMRELAARAAGAAALFADVGIGRGDRVALWLPNSVELVESFLGVLACGAAALPLAAAARPAEVRRILGETPVQALVAPPETLRALALPGVLPLASGPRGLDIAAAQRAQRNARLPLGTPSPPEPADAALVAYSSGTLAPPRVVVRTHENLWWEAENFWSATRLGPDDVVLGVVPLSHAHGLGNALLASLRAGARLVLRPRFLRRQTLDLLARERVTVFPTVPFMVRMLAATDGRRGWDLAALRLCFSAGAALAPETYAAFRARFGVPVRQLYGLTEAGSVTLNSAPAAEIDPASAGTPLGSVRVTIEDPQGREIPRGAIGEIVVRSPAAAGGVERALRTHDQGHWTARGELLITGRTSLFINTAGNKVDPAEVEAALRLHPAVAEAAVFGLPASHGEQVVAAAVVRRAPCTADALRLHCRTLLATYKVPRVLSFRTALPRSLLGKVLIGQLLTSMSP
jgi:long-chain acyl-CoA synthetase